MKILLTWTHPGVNKDANKINRRHTNNTNAEVHDRRMSNLQHTPSPEKSKRESEIKAIKDYSRRHSCLISVSKLDNSKDGSNYVHLK